MVQSFACHRRRCGIPVARHGLEVPKFVFVAVGFETYVHAKSMAQLVTF